MSWPLAWAAKKRPRGASVACHSFAARKIRSTVSGDIPPTGPGSSKGRPWASMARGSAGSGVAAAARRIRGLPPPKGIVSRGP